MESTIISKNLVDKLITKSKSVLHHNNVIRYKLKPYSKNIFDGINSELTMQQGIIQQNNKCNYIKNNTSQVKSVEKDEYCTKCVQLQKKISLNRRSTLSKTKSLKLRKKMESLSSLTQKTKNPTKLKRIEIPRNQKLIKLKKQENLRGRIILKNTEQQILKKQKIFRQNKKIQEEIKRNQHQEKQKYNQIKDQKEQKIKEYMKIHLSKKKNLTFDHEGQIIFLKNKSDLQQQQVYPPTVKYIIESANKILSDSWFKDENFNSIYFQNTPSKQKLKAAQGKAFASAVMKTVNFSRISLNGNTNNDEKDSFKFMHRNDLFNNNHSRQTTSVPFLQLQEGNIYKEVQNNSNRSDLFFGNAKKIQAYNQSNIQDKQERFQKTKKIYISHKKSKYERPLTSQSHCRVRAGSHFSQYFLK